MRTLLLALALLQARQLPVPNSQLPTYREAPITTSLGVGNWSLGIAPQPSSRLGTIEFPASGKPAAHQRFIAGVLWLHSFGYEDAIEEFRAAQRLDPGFVLAYWGEAMCHNQPVWQTQNVMAGRAALAKLAPTAPARADRAPTDREKRYLAAVDLLFNGAGDKSARDRAYADAMGRLAQAYPADAEAAVFHALALLGTLPLGVSDPAVTLKAGAIAEGVLARNAAHPGAAHVIIHAYDDREHVSRALGAARLYAKLAPDSSHALHMPSHVFHQLGLWDEAVASDEAAFRVSNERVTRKKLTVLQRDYHPLSWLAYEYLQQGRFAKARAAWKPLEEAIAVARAAEKTPARAAPALGAAHHEEAVRTLDSVGLRNDLATMRAHHVIETQQWEIMRGATWFDNVDELFVLGYSSVKLGDIARAKAAHELLQKFTAEDRDEGRKPIAIAMTRQLEGLLHLAEGRTDAAVEALRHAAATEDRMRRPVARPKPVKPSHELLGEVLLEVGRPAEAVVAFERALWRSSNRSAAVLGLARAHAKLGQREASVRQYRQFLKNWHGADAGLRQLEEARKAGADKNSQPPIPNSQGARKPR